MTDAHQSSDARDMNIRGASPISREERRDIRRLHQLGGFLEYDALPDWQSCDVRPEVLRIVHDDFRGEPIKKGELISVYVERVRERIEADDFPFAGDIRRRWPDKPPIYVLRTRINGELYVYDGQKRTINACYHHDEWVPALIVDVDEHRELL